MGMGRGLKSLAVIGSVVLCSVAALGSHPTRALAYSGGGCNPQRSNNGSSYQDGWYDFVSDISTTYPIGGATVTASTYNPYQASAPSGYHSTTSVWSMMQQRNANGTLG